MLTYVIKNDDPFFVDSLNQVRAISPWRFVPMMLRILAVLATVAIAVSRWRQRELAAIAFVTALVALVFLWPRRRYDYLRRRFRRAAGYNEEVTLHISDEHLRWSVPGSVTEQDWRYLTRVVRRPTGFLVYQRSGVAWWPDSALREGSPTDVEAVLRGKAVPFVVR